MMRAVVLCVGVLGAGCSVGGDPPTCAGASCGDQLQRVCGSTLTVSGSFTQSAAPPTTPYDGCWPIGTWTFSAAVATNDCQTAPSMLPAYSFQGTTTVDPDTGDLLQQFSYLTDPTAHNLIRVSEAGNKACEGELDLYSPDGLQVWTLKPWLDANNVVSGEGDYWLYKTNQWVPGS